MATVGAKYTRRANITAEQVCNGKTPDYVSEWFVSAEYIVHYEYNYVESLTNAAVINNARFTEYSLEGGKWVYRTGTGRNFPRKVDGFAGRRVEREMTLSADMDPHDNIHVGNGIDV